jgi:fructokinase
MNSDTYTVVGLGELIWDILPDGRQLGGATTNFAYISRLLGDNSVVASRTGMDELGSEAIRKLARMGISTDYIQRDPGHPTGTVRVHVDERGEASYAANEDSAWDYLEWTPLWEELAARCDAVCFGTLSQRAALSSATIKRFLQATRPEALRVFDVNLRHTFFHARRFSDFTTELLTDSLRLASIAKLNRGELPRVAAMLGLDGRDEHTFAARLREDFDLRLVAVTRGAGGSLLVSAAGSVEHAGLRVAVVDTIGAGDAFAAALAHYYLRGAPLEQLGEAANRTGAWVASHAGATPEVAPDEFRADLK